MLFFPLSIFAGEAELISLSDCERMAVENHPTLRLAREETKLADVKKGEAFRGIWPSLTAKGEYTDGAAIPELGSPGFREMSYGVQMTQPVIQGGRLVRVYGQAKAQWLAVQAKEEKARQEVLFGARESYWNLVKADRTVKIAGQALKDLREERTLSQRLLDNDVISRQVHLTVSSQYEQAVLSLEGAEAEAVSRLWQWTAAVGSTEPPTGRPIAEFPKETLNDPSLESCLARARGMHPDLEIQRQSAEAARQGDLAGRGLYYPKLSINGFYGRSGGNWDREELTLGEDWNIGAQLSQYFGGNTLNVSASDLKTSPKLGQTTRTEATTYGASFGFFDALKGRTETAEARYTWHQAEEERIRLEMQVGNDVRGAWAEWKRALSRRRVTENDWALARTDFEVARIKSANREVPVSDRAVTRNRLAQAEADWVEAQAQYYIAAAALARAVGDSEFFFKKDAQ